MATSLARARMLRISPRKLRLVADVIRGRKVKDARDYLAFTTKRAAPMLSKVLESAVANAEDVASRASGERLDSDEMVVASILVNEGPMLKRFRAAPRGRAVRVRKRTSHIELRLSDEKQG